MCLFIHIYTVQHQTLAGQNFGGFETAKNLLEKILAAGHTNDSSLFKLTAFGGQNFGRLLIVHQIHQSFLPPKFCAVQ